MNFSSPEAKEKFIASITCSICMEMYTAERRPGSLSCGHSLCKNCILDLIAFKNELLCPLDRKPFTMDANNIPINYDLLQLANLYAEQTQRTKGQSRFIKIFNKPQAPQAPKVPQTTQSPVSPPIFPQIPIAPSAPSATSAFTDQRVSTTADDLIIDNLRHSTLVCKLVRPAPYKKYGFDFKTTRDGMHLLGNIIPDSIAYKAGIRENDCVIEVNGKKAGNDSNMSHEDFIKIMSEDQFKIEMIVSRGHSYTFDNSKREAANKKSENEKDTKKSNMDVTYRMIEPIVGFKGLGFSVDCVKGKKYFVITKVAPSSPSEKAGLKVGEKLVEVNGVDVRSVSGLKELFELMKMNPKMLMLGIKKK